MVHFFGKGLVCVLTIQHLVIFAPYRVPASCSEDCSIARLSEKSDAYNSSFHLSIKAVLVCFGFTLHCITIDFKKKQNQTWIAQMENALMLQHAKLANFSFGAVLK